MINIRPFVIRDTRDVIAEGAQFTNGIIALYSEAEGPFFYLNEDVVRARYPDDQIVWWDDEGDPFDERGLG